MSADDPAVDVDVLVVGAGFAGSVLAERCASAGLSVLVIDQREHIAGNAYDHLDEHGVRVHAYGPHLFHTNAPKVVEYLSRFTDWRPYEHRVLADIDGQLVPMPINRTTLNAVYGLELPDDAAAAEFLASRAETPAAGIHNSEQAVTSKVGRDLYERFFRGYTRKQWGKDPAELAASVCARIPIRTNTDDRYFTDTHQALPAAGYTAMFERMLDHPNIEVRTSTPFAAVRDELRWRHLVWTGPIDEFHGHRFGPLPYRSLRFELRHDPTPGGGTVQPVATVNFPAEDVPWTRITEFAHLSEERHEISTRIVEFPSAQGDPYYPVPAEENQQLYRRYAELEAPGVTFVGRLATYRYYNMDQVVAQALATFERIRDELVLLSARP